MNRLNLVNDEYKKMYSLLEEACSKGRKSIEDLRFGIGKIVFAPEERGCEKKHDGWYYYAYDGYVHLFDTIGPIKDFDVFMCILSIKLNIDIEGYEITREAVTALDEGRKKN